MKLQRKIKQWQTEGGHILVHSDSDSTWQIYSQNSELYQFCRTYLESVYGRPRPAFHTYQEAMKITDEIVLEWNKYFSSKSFTSRPFKASLVTWWNEDHTFCFSKTDKGWDIFTVYREKKEKDWLLFHIDWKKQKKIFKTKDEAVEWTNKTMVKANRIWKKPLLKGIYRLSSG